jgi:AcrR family transcriptional regulator/DNA-binding MarR family transcriptional regulator
VPHAQIAEIQRSRLLAGAIRAVEELGYADTTVAQITSRARVSRRTFYELFPNREACLAAVLQHVVALIENDLAQIELTSLAWHERVRMGLWTILSFFDREPVLARVCVVQALRGGSAVLDLRQETLARLAAILDEGRRESARAGDFTALTAEGLVGAALAIVHARLLRGQREPLRGLLGELMRLIVLPYKGAAAARKEQTRPAPDPLLGGARMFVKIARPARDPLDGVAMRLTYRTARVLEGIGDHPGVSNRAIADHAGIGDQGQVSKLLARLERLGLLANQGSGQLKGEPNSWELTTKGERVAQSIRTHRPDRQESV